MLPFAFAKLPMRLMKKERGTRSKIEFAVDDHQVVQWISAGVVEVSFQNLRHRSKLRARKIMVVYIEMKDARTLQLKYYS